MADAKTPENLAKIIEQLNKANEIFPEIQIYSHKEFDYKNS